MCTEYGKGPFVKPASGPKSGNSPFTWKIYRYGIDPFKVIVINLSVMSYNTAVSLTPLMRLGIQS